MSNSTSDNSKRARPLPWWQRLNGQFRSPATPDPWLRRKFVVIIVLALSAWCLYIAIGRVCVPAIKRLPGSAFSHGAGIGLLVAYLMLWLMFMWTYLSICLVGPGHAKEFIPETEDPAWKTSYGIAERSATSSEQPYYFDGARPYPAEPPAAYVPEGHDFPETLTWGGYVDGQTRHNMPFSGSPQAAAAYPAPNGHDFPETLSGSSWPAAHSSHSISPVRRSETGAIYPTSNAPPQRPNDQLTPWAPLPLPPPPPPPPPPPTEPPVSSTSPMVRTSRLARPVPGVSTSPRWCYHCKIIKPDRTHHCRHCGTCILQFDHHCIWIGQCVGWRNHAIFVTFCLWAGIFCCFNTVVLVVDSCLSEEIDPQKMAILTISGILFIFTLLMMLPTHVYLILVGRSTVESFQTGTQRDAEEAALKLEFNNPACPTKEIRAIRKEWEKEYGGVAVNDRWRVGRKRDRWTQEMGKHWFGWILPVGKPLGDGIHYVQNPRFGPHGEWLPMREWPAELRDSRSRG